VRRLFGSLVVLAHVRGQRRAAFLARHRIEALRDARVRRIVAHAARTVPYYRDLFARERIDPRDIRGVRELDALPLLDREAVRRHPERFLSTSRRARGALPYLTSGTTGTPLTVHHDRRSVLANIGWGERERAPLIELCGGVFRPREVYIGYDTSNFGKVLAFYGRATRLPRPKRTTVSMTSPIDDIVATINRMRPDILTAYGSFLDMFLRAVSARGLEMYRPRAIVYMGETLPVDRRLWIERELGVPVLSRYCAVESFKIGYFCAERTGFHLHDDLCHVRVLRDDGRDAAAGELGEVVISNLVNHATVLLNYPMGDLAAIAASPCPCGRHHRLLSEIQGRVEDVIPLPDGRFVHPRAVWAVFKEDRTVVEYQLVQHDLQHFELRLVTAGEDAFPAARDRAIAELRGLLGSGARFDASRHAELGRTQRQATGKFRAVESRVAAAVSGA